MMCLQIPGDTILGTLPYWVGKKCISAKGDVPLAAVNDIYILK